MSLGIRLAFLPLNVYSIRNSSRYSCGEIRQTGELTLIRYFDAMPEVKQLQRSHRVALQQLVSWP